MDKLSEWLYHDNSTKNISIDIVIVTVIIIVIESSWYWHRAMA